MNKIRVKGVSLDKRGRREVTISHGGERRYYGHFPSLETANARARDVWQWVEATGRLPIIVEQEGKTIGQCPLAPVE